MKPFREAMPSSAFGLSAAGAGVLLVTTSASATLPPLYSMPISSLVSCRFPGGQVATSLAETVSNAQMMGFVIEVGNTLPQTQQSEFVNPLELCDASAYAPDVPDTEAMNQLCARARAGAAHFEEAEDDVPFDEAWL